jgi:hypothetical protein
MAVRNEKPVNDPPRHFKVVRTDRDLELQRVDSRLREAGAPLALLPDGTERFKPIQQAMHQDGRAWPEARWLAGDLSGKHVIAPISSL